MKAKKLVLYRETLQRLDPQNLSRAAAGIAPGGDVAPAERFRGTNDVTWCVSCQSNMLTACYTDRSIIDEYTM